MSENKVLKAGIGYTFANYLISGLNFLTIPIFARLLSTSDYGIYNTFAAYQSILFVFIGCALNTSYKNARYKYKFKSESPNKSYCYEEYASSSIVFTIINSVIYALILNILYPYISKYIGINRLLVNCLIIASFGQALISLFNADASLTYSYKSYIKISLVNAISNVIVSIFLIVFVLNVNKYLGRVFGNCIPLFFAGLYIIVKFFKRSKPGYTKGYIKWGLAYSLPIIPHAISQIILSQFDRIMINNMIGSSEAGIYSFAYTIFTIISVTYTSLDTVWSQWFYDHLNKKLYKPIRTKSNIYMILMCMFSSMVILLSPEIITILGTSKFHDSIYCVIPIIVGGFLSFLYLIPAGVEYYTENTKFIALGTTSAAIINIILNYVFILRYGYQAAAYTTLVTYLLNFIFHYLISRKLYDVILFDLRVIVSSILLILVIAIISFAYLDSFVIRLVIFIILMILFLIVEEKNIHLIAKIKLKYIK